MCHCITQAVDITHMQENMPSNIILQIAAVMKICTTPSSGIALLTRFIHNLAVKGKNRGNGVRDLHQPARWQRVVDIEEYASWHNGKESSGSILLVKK
jgi:hypothetical protein